LIQSDPKKASDKGDMLAYFLADSEFKNSED
jgi:hypothetical protein